jgi:hypothetical protein
MPCSRCGKPRQIGINARRCQKSEWEAFWTQALRLNKKEVAHRANKLDGKPPEPASIRARARYAEYCARKRTLSKANQAMTSHITPSAAPTSINELRAKNPEPTHPDRDPITHPASLLWPPKADSGAYEAAKQAEEQVKRRKLNSF